MTADQLGTRWCWRDYVHKYIRDYVQSIFR